VIGPAQSLRGRVRVVSDKSLTHRGLLLGALAEGETVLEQPNRGADCRATLRAVQSLGAEVQESSDAWIVRGGRDRLHEPADILDLGNAGTGIRLLCGVAAGIPGLSILTGDESLRRRPMQRVIGPLAQMGARIDSRRGGHAPLAVRGGTLGPIAWKSEAASAQIKSAILLAGLFVDRGMVSVEEPAPSRDHTERLLRFLGVPVSCEGSIVSLQAPAHLTARSWRVPGDPSAAAFLVAAATLVEGSEIVIEEVDLNPTRTGALAVFERMGAKIGRRLSPSAGPEPYGDLAVAHAPLQATVVEAHEVPSLIDEIPILAVSAALARGNTEFRGVGELRHKESDRIESVASLLQALGVKVETGPDWLIVHGGGTLAGGRVQSQGDHRIAMSAIVAGLVSSSPVELDDASMIETSDPQFHDNLARLTGGAS
jgi:3-phosphoshikimate 1-carboxyvinyltransferase